MFLNAFKNLFTPKPTKTAFKKGIRRRLELLGLEDRIVPAVPFSPAFPHALSINSGSSTSTSASFTVTFNQPVTGVDTADFNLIATGTVANGTISSLTGSGATYTINVTGITGTGTLGLNLVDLPSITALPSFAAKQDFATSTHPLSVTLGDVNGDGKLDMVTANYYSNASVLLGNGNGTFAAQATFTTAKGPYSVTLGDVNGDGKLDIITANSLANNASVLLGNGNGTFQPKADFATGNTPRYVTLGDVNGDGKLDIITANNKAATTSVLLGNGNGTFQPKTDFAVGNDPYTVALGDVNGDGKLDIITANFVSDTASVLLGNGNGTFQTQATFATGQRPSSVALGDVNGDGKLDIIASPRYAGSVSVLLGNGNGTFQPKADFAVGILCTSVTLGDVNGDGRLDIMVANTYNKSVVSVLLGNGNGTFQPSVDFGTGGTPRSVTMGDVNGDGRLDIITANYTGNNASVLLGTGGSAIKATFLPQQTFATDTTPLSATMGDVNGDGKLDIITANYLSDTASVLLGNGNGTFGAKASFATGTNPKSVTLGDVNRDGRLDIIIANSGSNSVSVLLGNGNGTFGPKTDFATALSPSGITMGDVNGDGNLDIITANYDPSNVSVLLGNGNGTFQAQQTFATGKSPYGVTLGDVNGDGKLDIITANNGANSASVLLGNGNGTFQAQQTFTTGKATRSVTLGDVNGDGRLDIITSNNFSFNVSLLLGNGNGTFQAQQTFAAGTGPQGITLGDINGDGRLDIITTNNNDSNSSVLLGNGNGTFQGQQTFATGTQPRTVTLGDVNGDGRLDIITANAVSSNVSVLLNSLGFTGQTVTFSSGPTVTSSTSNLAATATTLIITGSGFDTTAGNNTVTLNSGTGTVTSATATQLTVTLNTPPSVGNLTAVVTSNGSSSGSPVQVATVVAGAATQATLTTLAAGSASGSAFTTQPIITIQDALGNTVTNSNASVTMTVSGGDNKATTVGTVTINAVNGVANFSGVGISGTAGTTYLLTFASNGLTSATQSITPTFGAATQATLGTSAAGSASGSAFTTQPVITIKDAFGNTVTNSTAAVTMSVSGNGATVGSATVNAVAGVANFSGVGISGTAGTPYTLTFASNGLTSATQSITPTFGAATQATLSTPAAGSVSGSAFTTQPVITIKDAFGNTVTNSTAAVTMTVSGNGTTVGTATVNAVAGVATFTNAGISGTTGTPYTLTFASNGLTSATQSITPTFGAATQLTLGTSAAGSASGSAFTTQPIITIKDALGNTVTNSTASVTMTVSGGDNKATTVGTVTINAVNGVANFSGVGISGTAGTTYTLTFASNGLTSATQSITPTFGAATQATLGTSAAGSASGSAFTTQPVITIKDAFGNTVTNSTASVTMTVSGNGTIVGTATVNAVAGVANFSGVGISGTAGTPYTLTFASNGLTSATQSITPTFGAATQATLSTPAAGSVSGSAFITQPVITIKDAFGNTVTNSTAAVTMTVSGNGTTVGTATVNAVAGVATFTNAGISGTAGTPYTLTFASGALTSATQSITPTFGAATQLTLGTSAAGSASGSAFITQPVITIKDAFGNTVTNSSAAITMTVSGNGTTAGTATVNAVAGVATFTNVGISGTAGTPYTLTFASAGLTSATQSITPTFGTATQAILLTQAAGSVSGSAFTTQPVIQIKDAFGNIVTNSSAAVTMSVSGNGTTVGTTTVNAVAGVATFTNVGISGTAGTPYTLTFASGALTSATQSITPLGVANTPSFGSPTPTADGFTVQITNYDANFTYGGTATANGTVAISSTGLVTVTGVAPNTSSTATVTTTRTNYLSGSAPVTVTSLNAANIPAFGATTPTADGFTVQITNYNGAFTYGGTATANGTVTISNTGLVTVTGVAPNTSSTAIITTTQTGFANGSAQVTAISLGSKPLITGTPSLPSSSGSSTVNLYDLTTGQPNGTAVPFPGFDGPVKVASGDLNNDGIAELVAGAGIGGGPAIAILNSQTGEILETFFAFSPAFTGGVFVAVQDANGDGILDIIATAGPGGGPEVRIFNGDGLTVLRSFFAYAQDFSGGVSVASIDFNNDGILDLVTGAGLGGAPHVKVFDGATNAVISQWYAYPVSFTGGVYVAVGDIGNDGTFEVVTGAGIGGAPVVAVWDPFTGALISQFMAYADVFTGGVRVAINDGNGDGITDLITGAGPTGGPHVKIFSFPDLDILFQFYSGEQSNPGGVFVS